MMKPRVAGHELTNPNGDEGGSHHVVVGDAGNSYRPVPLFHT